MYLGRTEVGRYLGIISCVDGFVTYSDGMHDDVNKHVWSALGWNPDANMRDAMIEYRS